MSQAGRRVAAAESWLPAGGGEAEAAVRWLESQFEVSWRCTGTTQATKMYDSYVRYVRLQPYGYRQVPGVVVRSMILLIDDVAGGRDAMHWQPRCGRSRGEGG